MTGILEKLSGHLRKKTVSAVDAYRAMIRQLASGQKEPSVEQVAEILDAAGKTPGDAEKDLDTYQQRIALQAKVNRLPAANREQSELDSQLKKAREEFEAAEQKFVRVTEPIYQRSRELAAEMAAGESAGRELLETNPYPELVERHEAARFESEESTRQIIRHENAIRDLEAEIKREMGFAFNNSLGLGYLGAMKGRDDPHPTDPDEVKQEQVIGMMQANIDYINSAKRKKAQIPEIRAAIPELRENEAKARERLAELDKELLKP